MDLPSRSLAVLLPRTAAAVAEEEGVTADLPAAVEEGTADLLAVEEEQDMEEDPREEEGFRGRGG